MSPACPGEETERTRTRSPSLDGLEEHPAGAEVLKQEARTPSRIEQTSRCLAFTHSPPQVSFYGDGAILKMLSAIKIKPESHIWASGETTVETWNTKAIYTVRERSGKKLTTGF